MKTRQGFTLAEVMLALTVLITSAYILSNIQIRSSFKVAKNREEIRRVFLIKKELYNLLLSPLKKDKPRTTTLNTPPTKIVSDKKKIERKSSLKNFQNDIDIIWSEGEWELSGKMHTLKMISFAPKFVEKEKS